ncbi:hypothetical protein BDV98DRAFT_303944 [Pterulicium gracile]|uniref:Uncharacterized protein n=1 Tax=Pterulicium gracile TaxID=1884261 RepID=A0A5C3Q3G3_9AGAR|nr:hypothetical protein BDV98DRAFT_303944 [Pterula gracilis]
MSGRAACAEALYAVLQCNVNSQLCGLRTIVACLDHAQLRFDATYGRLLFQSPQWALMGSRAMIMTLLRLPLLRYKSFMCPANVTHRIPFSIRLTLGTAQCNFFKISQSEQMSQSQDHSSTPSLTNRHRCFHCGTTGNFAQFARARDLSGTFYRCRNCHEY